MRNNIGFPNDNSYIDGYGVDTKSNTWDLGITPAAKDFLSVTDPSLTAKDASVGTTPGALGPRPANGGLPDVNFLKLAAGSAMIDKGTDVQLPFIGAAPDLGAYEFGATTFVTPYQPSSRETMPCFFSRGKFDGRKIQVFDMAGRTFEYGMINSSFRPVMYTAPQPDGSTRANTIIRMR
jgi:hypothetical protein